MDRMPPPYQPTSSSSSSTSVSPTNPSTTVPASKLRAPDDGKSTGGAPPEVGGLGVKPLSPAQVPQATPSFAKATPLTISSLADSVPVGAKGASPLTSRGVTQSLGLLESLPREAAMPWDKAGRQCVGMLKLMLEAHQPLSPSRSTDILTTFRHEIEALRMLASAQLDQVTAGGAVTLGGRWMQAAPAGHEATWKAVKVATFQLRVTLTELVECTAILDLLASAATSTTRLANHPDILERLPRIESLVSEDLVEFSRDLAQSLASLPRDLFETDRKSSE